MHRDSEKTTNMKNSIYCFKQEQTKRGKRWRLTGIFGEPLPVEELLKIVDPPHEPEPAGMTLDIAYEELTE